MLKSSLYRLLGLVFPFWSVLMMGVAPQSSVELGLEQLQAPRWNEALRGRRLGVLAHQASRTQKGHHLVDLLRQEMGLDVRLIFAPEHGLRTLEDDWGRDGVDPASGLPVVSLYRPERRAPEASHWAKIDVLLVDLQDVGLRYYTYPTTLALAMQSAARAGKPIWVLDRPNPLGGQHVEGWVLEQALSGNFAAYYPIPTRHGMTLGELALYFNHQFKIGADLTVVPMRGWSRDLLWSDLGLRWPVPSPALTSFEQAALYSIVGPMETFNLAVGRGQTNELAFRVVGAPWISAEQSRRLAAELNSLGLSGLSFEPVEWKVTRAVYEGQVARGVRLGGGAVSALREGGTFEASLKLIQTFSRVLGRELQPSPASSRAVGSSWVLVELLSGRPVADFLETEKRECTRFRTEREKFLLY